MFCGHPSLRFGDVTHFVELWGSNPNNVIVFTEPSINHIEALAPFQVRNHRVNCAVMSWLLTGVNVQPRNLFHLLRGDAK